MEQGYAGPTGEGAVVVLVLKIGYKPEFFNSFFSY